MNIYLKPQMESYSLKYISENSKKSIENSRRSISGINEINKRSNSNISKRKINKAVNLNDLINLNFTKKSMPNFFRKRKSNLNLGSNSSNFLLPSKKNILLKKNIQNSKRNLKIQKKPVERKRTQSVSFRKKSLSRNKKKNKAPINIFSTMKKLGMQKSQIGKYFLENREKSYSVNTINGLTRDYNEDRISIVTNIKKKIGWRDSDWPKINYFGIFDGHGGSKCSDYLKLNLHKNIYDSLYFPTNVKKSIQEGCQKTEQDFLTLAETNQNYIEKSGSCGIFCFIIDKLVYIGNIGDSRLIVSEKQGQKIKQLTTDHKPSQKQEKSRITKNGGVVKRRESYTIARTTKKAIKKAKQKTPYRLYPGGLSVSRSFGDIMIKKNKFGGKKGCLIAIPEIFVYKIGKNTDFLFLGCDGIFDKVDNNNIVEYIWDYLRFNKNLKKSKKLEGLVNFVFEECMKTKSYDNLTGIFINIGKNTLC